MSRSTVADHSFDPVGFALVIISALCYSTLGILGKIAFEEGLTVLSLLSTRFTLGALLLWGFILMMPDMRRSLGEVPRRRLAVIFAWGIVGFAGQSTLFFSALRYISASLNVLLLYTCPAFIVIILWIRTRRRPTATILVALAMALGGIWLSAGALGHGIDIRGVALGIITGFWFAVFLIGLHRFSEGVPAVISGALIAVGAATAFDLAVAVTGAYSAPASARAWGAVVGMIVFTNIVGFVLLVIGIRRIGPQSTSILSTFEPLGTLLLAGAFLGERLDGRQWIGAVLIIGAAFALAGARFRSSRRKPAAN